MRMLPASKGKMDVVDMPKKPVATIDHRAISVGLGGTVLLDSDVGVWPLHSR